MKYQNKGQGYRYDREDDPFVELKAYVPRKTYELVKEVAADLGLPVSRLMCIALFNELRREDRFVLEMVEATDVKDDETVGLKLYDYLKKIPSGAGLDTLVLCHRDMDLTPGEVVYAYRFLLVNKLIEEYHPTKSKFKYGEEYRYIRAIGERPLAPVPKKVFKKHEGRIVKKRETDKRKVPATTVNQKGPIHAAIAKKFVGK